MCRCICVLCNFHLGITGVSECPVTATISVIETSPYQLPCNDTDNCSGHYTCLSNGEKQCLDGWQGDDCTDLLGDRQPRCINGMQQCLNRGTCWIDESICCCPDGFTGEACQDAIEHCWSSPCRNGGVCYDFVAQYVCDCPNGKTKGNCTC